MAAITDELGVTYNAVTKWKAGNRTASHQRLLLEHMDRLLQQRRVPPQRRYQKGTRNDSR